MDETTTIITLLASLRPGHIFLIFIIIVGLFIVIPNLTNIKNLLTRKRRKQGVNHHVNCPYRGDEFYFDTIEPHITAAIENALEIYELREKVLIQEQMSAVDKVTVKTKGLVMSAYKDLSHNPRDYRAYDKIVNDILYKMKDKLREYVKANHLVEQTEEEFRAYVQEVGDVLMSYFSDLLNEEYVSEDFEISRERLYEYNVSKIVDDILHLQIELLHTLREISKKNIDKVKKIEERKLK